MDDSLDSSCAAWGPLWLSVLRAQEGLGCSLPSVQLQMSLEDSSALLSSCQIFLLLPTGTPRHPRKKADLASMGRKLLMRHREGVMHSWLRAGWICCFKC